MDTAKWLSSLARSYRKGKAAASRAIRRNIPLLRKSVAKLYLWVFRWLKRTARIPNFFWIAVIIFIAVVIWYLVTPHPIAYRFSYRSYSSLPPLFASEDREMESDIQIALAGEYGGCAGYIASRMLIPAGFGNANTWDEMAKDIGWLVDKTPEVGAIAHWEYGFDGRGHVALVEEVVGDEVLISEKGFIFNPFVVNYRWVKSTDVDNFIHPRD